MVSHPETGSDSPIESDQDRGRDKETRDIIVRYGCKRPAVSSEKLCCPKKTHGHVYHKDFGLCDRSRD